MTQPPHNVGRFDLHWFGRTDVGKVRKNNEDSFLGLAFSNRGIQRLGRLGHATMGDSDFVFAVSDGLGGAKAGELASRITVEKILNWLPRSYRQSAMGLEAGFTDILEELFDDVNRALTYVGASYEECKGMQATLTLIWFTPTWLYFAHIGDTRLYYLPAREEKIKQLSHDDTHVGWLFRSGKINEREARTHPRRTSLQKALGAGAQFTDPQVGAVGYQPGDIFLLCTDGLVEGLYDSQLTEMLRSPEAASDIANQLVEKSLGNSGRDNTTALVIRVV